MFRFENPAYLWLLLLIPLMMVLVVVAYYVRRRNLKRFGDRELLRQLMPMVSTWRPQVKYVLLMGALALLAVALARPQMGSRISHEKREGIEVMIALDISNSMLAQDVTPSRLEKSKLLVENLVDHFNKDKVGLVVFAGEAFVQLPITSDYVSAKMFLQSITPGLISTQGTDIARVIRLAKSSFTQQKNVGRAIVVITDGEDHEGGAVEAAKEAREAGMNIFIMGIGDSKGAPIPLGNGEFMKDNNGETVMTALNEQMCREVAQAGKGAYIHIDNTSEAQEKLNNALARLQRGETESVIYSEYEDQFQYFLIAAILLLIIEVCVRESKSPLAGRFHLFRRGGKVTVVMAAMMLMPLCVMAQADRQFVRSGNRHFRAERYEKAEADYRKALAHNKEYATAMYDLGCALMMQQKDSLAVEQFNQAARTEQDKLRRSMSFHNIGVIMQNHKQYKEAIQAYQECLRINPGDHETRYNLALCKKLQKEEPQNQQNQQKQQKQDQDDNSQDKKKEQEQQPQQQEQQMSRENAEQLLNAAQQEENRTQQRLKKQQQQNPSRKLQKNW